MPPINPIDDIRRSAARASPSSRPSWAADPAAKSKVSENTQMAGKMTWKISISRLRIHLNPPNRRSPMAAGTTWLYQAPV